MQLFFLGLDPFKGLGAHRSGGTMAPDAVGFGRAEYWELGQASVGARISTFLLKTKFLALILGIVGNALTTETKITTS